MINVDLTSSPLINAFSLNTNQPAHLHEEPKLQHTMLPLPLVAPRDVSPNLTTLTAD